jgi:hypothetical protein
MIKMRGRGLISNIEIPKFSRNFDALCIKSQTCPHYISVIPVHDESHGSLTPQNPMAALHRNHKVGEDYENYRSPASACVGRLVERRGNVICIERPCGNGG